MSAPGAPPGAAPPPGLEKFTLEDYLRCFDTLGVPQGADEAAIQTAYRRRARETHPDKNRDKPDAEELFLAVKKASEVLLDASARAYFEAKLAARAAAEARFKGMDEARARMRAELEARERAAAEARRGGPGEGRAGSASGGASAGGSAPGGGSSDSSDAAALERLRRDGQAKLQAWENARAARRAAGVAAAASVLPSERPAPAPAGVGLLGSSSVRVTWSGEWAAAFGDDAIRTEEGGQPRKTLSAKALTSVFTPFGLVRGVVDRADRAAVVVFASPVAAAAAVATPPTGYKVAPVTAAPDSSSGMVDDDSTGDGEAGGGEDVDGAAAVAAFFAQEARVLARLRAAAAQ